MKQYEELIEPVCLSVYGTSQLLSYYHYFSSGVGRRDLKERIITSIYKLKFKVDSPLYETVIYPEYKTAKLRSLEWLNVCSCLEFEKWIVKFLLNYLRQAWRVFLLNLFILLHKDNIPLYQLKHLSFKTVLLCSISIYVEYTVHIKLRHLKFQGELLNLSRDRKMVSWIYARIFLILRRKILANLKTKFPTAWKSNKDDIVKRRMIDAVMYTT